MVKQHLKRLASPRTWAIKKKNITFITRPNPGPHKIDYQMPVNVVLRDLIGVANSTKEVKFILHNKDCSIDGVLCHDYRRPVGLMDSISIKSTGKNYRMLINKKNKLSLVEIDAKDAASKLVKIRKKTSLKGNKVQLNFTDGRNILIDDVKKYNVGDSLKIDLPSQKITEHLALQKGMTVLLTSGVHAGEKAVIESIEEAKIIVKMDKGTFTTNKEFGFVVGKDKPVITL